MIADHYPSLRWRGILAAVVLTFALAASGILLLPVRAHAEFGFVPGSLGAAAINENGTPDSQAGSHPYAYNVKFQLKLDENGRTEGGEVRDLIFDLPPGLVGNPLAVPRCPRADFEGFRPQCSPNTQVGILHAVVTGLGQASGPVYNMVSPPGVAGQLGFSLANYNALQNVSVRSEEGYGLRSTINDVPIEILSAEASIWGVPADPSHDDERGQLAAEGQGGSVASDSPRLPFLTMPATCDSPPEIAAMADSKLAPGIFAEESALTLDGGGNPAPLAGCDAVPFSPGVSAAPTTKLASSPSGLDFDLTLPNQGLLSPAGIAETEPRKTVVALPEGVTVNPAAAAGTVGCSQEQYRSATDDPGSGCPEASKVGTLVARTPLLEEPIEGSVYLAQPHDNKFDSLLALYILARAPGRGVLVKQAGLVTADPVTGQLTTTFDELPPLPYSSFEFDLREGPRAPLITPQACGEYTTTSWLYPFSDPSTATIRTAPFKITSGAEGSGCVSNESELPAHPTLEAGTSTPLAGDYSPFVFRVKRTDGEQRFSSIQATLPSGLLARLAGVPYCPESGLAAASSRMQEGGGGQEVASPSCPAASQIGTVNVGAGAGPQPYYVQGKAYLAGPYKGAPLSMAIVTPAVAGPFDLGTVVVRAGLYVDESSAQVGVKSDPIPTILAGIPLDIRSVSVQIDRNQFTLNPTRCEAMTIEGSVISTVGQVAPLTNRFQVGGCAGLGFKPKLALSLKGGTQRTKHPALRAVVTYPQGGAYANIAKAAVILPAAEFIDQGHISNPCTRVQFRAQACPAASVLGKARAFTPLLDKPLEGPVYFRSNGNDRELPDVVADLNGQIHLVLVGFIDSVRKKGSETARLRTTFATVPDAPVSKFVLELNGGKKKGALVNSENLCAAPQRAAIKFTAQNGKTYNAKPLVANSCGKKSKGRKARR